MTYTAADMRHAFLMGTRIGSEEHLRDPTMQEGSEAVLRRWFAEAARRWPDQTGAPLDGRTLEAVLAMERAAIAHPLIKRDPRTFSAAAALLLDAQGLDVPEEVRGIVATTRKGWADPPSETDERCRRLNAWAFATGTDDPTEPQPGEYPTIAALKQDVALLIISYHVATMQPARRDLLAPFAHARVTSIIRHTTGQFRLMMMVEPGQGGHGMIERIDDSVDAILSWLSFHPDLWR